MSKASPDIALRDNLVLEIMSRVLCGSPARAESAKGGKEVESGNTSGRQRNTLIPAC